MLLWLAFFLCTATIVYAGTNLSRTGWIITDFLVFRSAPLTGKGKGYQCR